MRTPKSRALFGALALGCLLLAAPAAMAGEEDEEIVSFTDGKGEDLDGDGVFDPLPGQRYCIYTVGAITQGNCPFAKGDVLCLDCPAAGRCPATANQVRRFRYWNLAGQLVCTGEWTRNIFDPTNPNACIECKNGKTAYQFY